MQKIIEVSDYEIERGKPMPSAIQANLIFALAMFRDKFNIHSELTFEINFENLTPDVCLLPKQKIDYQSDIIRLQPHQLLQ